MAGTPSASQVRQSAKRPFNRCMICGSSRSSPIFDVDTVPIHPFCPPSALDLQPGFGSLAIVCCDDCGHIYNSAFNTNQVDDLYAATVLTNTPVSESMIKGLENTADFILSRAPAHPVVVDVGGGTGVLARAMVPRSREVHLVEPSRALTAEQFAGTGVTLHQSMFPAASLGDKTFDVIVSRQVIEHIPDPLSFLIALRSRLNDSGMAYIETPSVEYIQDNLSIVDFHYPHVHYYRRGVMEELFARSGFEVVETLEIKNGHDVGFLLRAAVAQAAARPAGAPPPPSLAKALDQRRRAGKERLGALTGKLALYGANAYSQALLGLYPDAADYAVMFDDTPMYEGQRAYGPGIDLEIRRPKSALLENIDAVVVTAYLHDVVITKNLRNLGFSGPVYTVRADNQAGQGDVPPSLFMP